MPDECAPAVCSLKCSRLLTGVVKNGSFKGLRDLKIKKISLANGCFFVFSWYKCFQRHFFWQRQFFCRGCVEFESLRFCVRTTRIWSQNFSERGVGSGWRRGGRAEDIYVFEDQG
jgi:hypothetical protein